jgi:hypothetical protein
LLRIIPPQENIRPFIGEYDVASFKYSPYNLTEVKNFDGFAAKETEIAAG